MYKKNKKNLPGKEVPGRFRGYIIIFKKKEVV